MLDLILCAIICKVCVVTSATTRLLLDKETRKIYYLRDSLIVGGRVHSTELNSDDEDEHEESMRRLPSHYIDSLTDLGWEGMIVAQLISTQGSNTSKSNILAASQENLLDD